MSSSASPGRVEDLGGMARSMTALVPRLEPFPYDSISADPNLDAILRDTGAGVPSNRVVRGARDSDAAMLEAQARSEGRQEGRGEARQEFQAQLDRERTAIASALAQFTQDRATYFATVEGEVVQLALSIARKILHREAQLDPLLLAGMVRVAMESIDGATAVKLRVHPQNAAAWRDYLSAHLETSDLPEIVEDATQPPDRCTLETSMGVAVVGVEVQLKEIEQGLLDLLAARPGAAS